MKQNTGWIITIVLLSLILIFSLIFSSLGSSTALVEATSSVASTLTLIPFETTTPSSTVTPDPCSPQNISREVERLHSLTREFEDTAMLLTSTLLRDTSVPLVQDLQRIRRAAEDQVVPSCLAGLKKYQIVHMNARIEVFGTALAFLNLYGTNGDQNALNKLLEPLYAKAEAAARQYEIEYSRLLGFTPVPTLPANITGTPTP